MERILFIIVALCMCNPVLPQEPEKVKTVSRKNEIKLNFPYFFLPGISYERFIAKNVSLGLAAEPSFHWGENTYIDDFFHIRISPYSRYYYKALFIEANTALSRFEYYNKFGLGMVLGCKFVNRKGFIGELFFGGGVYMDNMNGGYWRFGVAVGKQFN